MKALKPFLITAIFVGLVVESAGAQQKADTEVVVLGVSHSAMLVAKPNRPAVYRAYIDRVEPDAICIERPPEKFARGSHYEFTYEIQDIAVPYAREEDIALCPFDWMPAAEDQLLAFGVDLANLPFVRRPKTYASFLTYPDPAELSRGLFYWESAAARDEFREWYRAVPEKPRFDFPRRLFLYRTFLQAMRIAEAAREHEGGRVLVIVGAMHKEDIEAILTDEKGIRLVAPTHFGEPTADEVAAHVRPADLAAIATFNLLGAQARTGNVDWDWLRDVVNRLQADQPGAESDLFDTRLEVLTGELAPAEAIEQYRAIQTGHGTNILFTWTGVIDSARIDSFADPFGNLTVVQRAALEEARELLELGKREAAVSIRADLEAALSPMKAGQLRAYWPDWIEEERHQEPEAMP